MPSCGTVCVCCSVQLCYGFRVLFWWCGAPAWVIIYESGCGGLSPTGGVIEKHMQENVGLSRPLGGHAGYVHACCVSAWGMCQAEPSQGRGGVTCKVLVWTRSDYAKMLISTEAFCLCRVLTVPFFGAGWCGWIVKGQSGRTLRPSCPRSFHSSFFSNCCASTSITICQVVISCYAESSPHYTPATPSWTPPSLPATPSQNPHRPLLDTPQPASSGLVSFYPSFPCLHIWPAKPRPPH